MCETPLYQGTSIDKFWMKEMRPLVNGAGVAYANSTYSNIRCD